MTDRPDLTHAPARKALGQHFLFDPDILTRTALAAGPVEGRCVFEIGPGPGGLTRALLDAGAARVIAIEADVRFADALLDWPEARTGQLHVHHADARRVDWTDCLAQAGGKAPAMVVANLPYNVGTPLTVSWLKAGPWRGEMALMFQKEVAERLCAPPRSAHYGRLAVLAGARVSAHIAFTLPPGAFRPPPRVDSAVAVLRPLPEGEQFKDVPALEKVAAAAFGQRRKMLRAALKSLGRTVGLDAADWLEQAAIDPTARAETLSQSDFRALATLFAAAGP